jgi:hypothetical protein
MTPIPPKPIPNSDFHVSEGQQTRTPEHWFFHARPASPMILPQRRSKVGDNLPNLAVLPSSRHVTAIVISPLTILEGWAQNP